MLGDKQRRRRGRMVEKEKRRGGRGTHDVGMINALSTRISLCPYVLLIPLDLLPWHGLQYDLACDV